MKKRYWIASVVGLLLVLMSAIVVFAIDGTAVDWWVMAGGGAPSSGDSITTNGTLGQPVVGLSSGGTVLSCPAVDQSHQTFVGSSRANLGMWQVSQATEFT